MISAKDGVTRLTLMINSCTFPPKCTLIDHQVDGLKTKRVSPCKFYSSLNETSTLRSKSESALFPGSRQDQFVIHS